MIAASVAGDKWIIKANNGDWQHVVTYAGSTTVGTSRKVRFVEPTAAAAVDGYALSWAVRGKVTGLGIHKRNRSALQHHIRKVRSKRLLH